MTEDNSEDKSEDKSVGNSYVEFWHAITIALVIAGLWLGYLLFIRQPQCSNMPVVSIANIFGRCDMI